MAVKKMVGGAHAAVLLLVLCMAGCSASKGKVTLHGEQGRTIYAQTFNQAYISNSREGEYDVLLIQDPQTSKAESRGNKPLQPMAAAALRQMVHIHVFWQAQGGSVAKDGVVTNAAIDWYVIAHEASDRPQILHYEGAGYVLLDEGKKTTSVEIRDGSMKKTDLRGDLIDPLGPSRLAGTVKAQRNGPLVRATLSDIKAQMATFRTPAAAAVSEAR
jgi:hypothetical protein